MTNKTFYLDSTITKAVSKKGSSSLKIVGYANTIIKDRQGDIIVPSAWAKGVENYRVNPILLFQHKADQPIGRVSSMRVDSKGLHIEAIISEVAEKQYGIQTLIKDKVLKGFSVGFRVKDQKFDRATDASTITDLELLEISIVSIPANQDSLFSVRKSFDSEKEYKQYIDTFEKGNDSLLAGITSFDDEHYHAFETDENGDGRTTFTSHGFSTHFHEIEDNELQEAQEHSHKPRVKDVVLNNEGEPTGEITLISDDEKENRIMTDTTKDDKVVTEEVSSTETLENTAIDAKEEIVEAKEEVSEEDEVEDVSENDPYAKIPLETQLSYNISDLKLDDKVKFTASRWIVTKIATNNSPKVQIKEVDIDGSYKNMTQYINVDDISIVNDWDINTGFDLELIQHSMLNKELTDDDRVKTKNEFDTLVNVSNDFLHKLRKQTEIAQNPNYQEKLQTLQNLKSLNQSEWTDSTYRLASRYTDMIKYLEAVKPSNDEVSDSQFDLALALNGHKADKVKEETTTMATNDKIVKQEDTTEEVQSTQEVAAGESQDKETASVTVKLGENNTEKLIEATGSKILEVSDKEDKGIDFAREIEELKELKADLRRERDAVTALTESKMQYAAPTRKENPFSASEMADAFMLCKAYAAKAGYSKNDEGLFDFSSLGIKMKAVTTVDAFLSNFSKTIHEELQQELVIAPMLRRIQVDARNFRVPVSNEDTDGDVAQFASGTFATGIADTTNVPTSNQSSIQAVTYTPHKFMAATHLALDEEEDTVLPLIGFLRSAAARRLARSIDKALLRGDGTISGFVQSPSGITVGAGSQSAIEGIMSLSSNHSFNDLRVNTGSDTAATPSDIASARAKLGKYGLRVGNDDLVYLTSTEGYNELVQTADFRTVDTFGPQATYHTGTLGAIYGIPVQISEFLDVKGSSQNLIGALIYKPGYLIAERRGMLVETEYEPRQQVTAIYMSTRIDMQPLTTNSSGGKAKVDNQYSFAVVLESTA